MENLTTLLSLLWPRHLTLVLRPFVWADFLIFFYLESRYFPGSEDAQMSLPSLTYSLHQMLESTSEIILFKWDVDKEQWNGRLGKERSVLQNMCDETASDNVQLRYCMATDSVHFFVHKLSHSVFLAIPFWQTRGSLKASISLFHVGTPAFCT